MSHPENKSASVPQTNGLGCLVRLAWLLLGHGVLLLSLMQVFAREKGSLGLADGMVWGAVIGCIVFRYYDVSCLGGLTATGKPASLAVWRRYALILFAVTLVLWGVARRSLLVGG